VPKATSRETRQISPDQERFYRLPDVEVISGFRRSTIYKMAAAGAFPKPIKIGASSVWPKSHLDPWLAERVR